MNSLYTKPKILWSSFFLIIASIAAFPDELPTIKLLATGGTIAMKVDPNTGAPVPALTGDEIAATVPQIRDHAILKVENLFNVPSPHMTPEHWIEIHAAVMKAVSDSEIDAVIITHGTDTMEETAYFLDLSVNTAKPIVLIGSQRNSSDVDFDGPRNLLDAVRLVSVKDAENKGVMVAFNEKVHRARSATKIHTSNVQTFDSGEYGLIARIDAAGVQFLNAPMRRQHLPLTSNSLPRVEIIAMYAGADESMLESMAKVGARGVVIEALGIGNVNERMYHAIEDLIQEGITVVVASASRNGRVLPLYGYVGGGKTLEDIGVVFAGDLSARKSRILLMLALQNKTSSREIQQLFDN